MSEVRRAVRWLEGQREAFGVHIAEERLRSLRLLGRRTCSSPAELVSLHESLCMARAYPDDRQVYELTHRLSREFHRRGDLKRFAAGLDGLGLSGVPIRYPFYWPTASWLTKRFPGSLNVDWDELDDDSALSKLLPVLFPRVGRHSFGGRGAISSGVFETLLCTWAD